MPIKFNQIKDALVETWKEQTFIQKFGFICGAIALSLFIWKNVLQNSLDHFPSFGSGGEIYMKIGGLKPSISGTDGCYILWDVINKTSNNFTDMYIGVVFRDSKGNIMSKEFINIDNLTPNGTAVANERYTNKCSEVSTIELTGIQSHTKIDGERLRNKEKDILSIKIKSSSNGYPFNIKSSGGTILDSDDSPKSSANTTKNMLENAVDPRTGNRKLWTEFKDNGGLNKVSSFYGLDVTSMQVQFKQDGTVETVLMQVPSVTAPKMMRSALNKICKTEDDEWKISDYGQIVATVVKGNVDCSYLGSSSQGYEVSYSVK